ncbi:MAG TPA: UDP-3-O-acyl-N-acetylglucosamine deacetylase [bacterium]|nr:UDP-3-O-acyl-N-acetylglucosamine deacetylase [bacterium]
MAKETAYRPQRTIRRPFDFEGTGLHTGKKCHVKVSPLPAGSGIRFYRSDMGAEIPLSPHRVTSTTRGTTLTGEKDAKIYTVEHFLATVQGVGMDNLKIEMDSEEMPILDGSSARFCELFQEAGVQEQESPVNPLKVTESMELAFGDVHLKVEPAEGLHLDVTTSFPYPGLENQRRSFHLADKSFERELAFARTFCFEEEVEQLRKEGLIKGGSLDCALVIGKKGVLNGPLRFEDEIVRHKTLDLLGDLMLLNRPLWAKVTVKKAGHRYHVELAKAIWDKFGKGPATSPGTLKGGPKMDINGIMNTLPHRYPFLMVDRVLELEPEKRIVAIKNVTANEPFFQGHFPGNPVMPGVLVIEALAQVGGIALISNGKVGKTFYLSGVDGARFRKPILPGDQLRLEVDILSLRSTIAKMAGKAFVDGKLAVEAEIMCSVFDPNGKGTGA